MLANQLLIHQTHDRHVDIQGIDIEQRQIEAARGDTGDILVAGQLILDQVGDERQVFLARLLDCLDRGSLVEQMILHDLAGKTGQLAARLSDNIAGIGSHRLSMVQGSGQPGIRRPSNNLTA